MLDNLDLTLKEHCVFLSNLTVLLACMYKNIRKILLTVWNMEYLVETIYKHICDIFFFIFQMQKTLRKTIHSSTYVNALKGKESKYNCSTSKIVKKPRGLLSYLKNIIVYGILHRREV